jgi:beta-phosphoglucomutase-like phosphatase (HAD superfamily)
MKVFNNDKTVFCDVDDTLIEWCHSINPDQKNADILKIGVPVDEGNISYTVSVKPIQSTIDTLNNLKAQGFVIIVWSQGGSKWAETVVKKLQLEDLVDLVVAKPSFILDDLDPP